MATDVVGSKMPGFASDALKPSKAGYGQNGYAGASSDLPGERTTSGFLPDTDYNAAYAEDVKIRDRNPGQPGGVSNKPFAPAFGMDQRTPRNK